MKTTIALEIVVFHKFRTFATYWWDWLQFYSNFRVDVSSDSFIYAIYTLETSESAYISTLEHDVLEIDLCPQYKCGHHQSDALSSIQLEIFILIVKQ